LSCELCGGTGFEIVERDGGEFARPCACRRGDSDDPTSDFLARCRVPARYEECGLAGFDAGTHSLRSALERCLRYCEGYPWLGQTEEGLGLLFSGENGVGKTHLAVGVLRELVTQKGASGQFWDFHELVREIKRSYDPGTRTTEVQVLEPVVETDVLLLDDLGAWRMTDWMVDTLFYILNTRYLAKRATIVTTNFQDVDKDKASRADPLHRREYLIDRIGARLRSRLMEMCVFIRIEGTDHRAARQEGLQAVVKGSTLRSMRRDG
jgi:DNA replication protein DnaC